MIRNVIQMSFVFALVAVIAAAANGQVTVTVDRNSEKEATKDFKFKSVKPPAKDDAGAKAKVTVLVGEPDTESGDISALTDGLVPTEENQPKSSFAFDSGSGGGRFTFDLGSVSEIKQVNTYSWQTGTHAPQVYMLYASDGADPTFCPEPAGDVDPSNCGWRLITTVDTRKGRGDLGGQYGVSIGDARGLLGKYRYLLFRVAPTETDDDDGNTYYSEIDVVVKNGKP